MGVGVHGGHTVAVGNGASGKLGVDRQIQHRYDTNEVTHILA